jgi:hypothetical protein
MTDELIRIERDELFTPAVDSALARERAGRERLVADPPPVSGLRRLLFHSMFYLPVAAALGAFVTWCLIEPSFTDFPVVGGEIALINSEPFDAPPGVIALTVGSAEVWVVPSRTKLDRGDRGQPAFASLDALRVGDKIEAVGISERSRVVAGVLRPFAGEPHTNLTRSSAVAFFLFPLAAALIALGLLLSEGITTRNWGRMVRRSIVGTFLAVLFSILAFLPAGLALWVAQAAFSGEAGKHDALIVTVNDLSPMVFIVVTACRSAAWAMIGAGLGLGMNLVRSTRPQLRNSVIGGALGGALGGAFFDPIDRFFRVSMFEGGGASRLVGLLAVGLCTGIFVALVERLGREAWLRVRTGPLAGKSFILHKTPTAIGNALSSDVYLYKDAEIDPLHASIHRVGTSYELEDHGSRTGTSVGGAKVQRRRLASGDQIMIGSTILDFEERQKRTPAA